MVNIFHLNVENLLQYLPYRLQTGIELTGSRAARTTEATVSGKGHQKKPAGLGSTTATSPGQSRPLPYLYIGFARKTVFFLCFFSTSHFLSPNSSYNIYITFFADVQLVDATAHGQWITGA